MSFPPLLQRYRLLTETLLFLSPWVRWMLIGGFCLALASSVIYYVTDWMPWVFLAAVGDAFLAVCLFVCIMGFPSQLLAIVTSRQLGFLPGIRQTSLVLLFLFCIFLPAGLLGVLWFFQKTVDYPAIFFTGFVLLSIYMTLGIVLASYIPMGQNFIVVFAFLWIKLVKLILVWSLATYVGVLVFIWLAFSVWWLRWRPQRYLMNAMVLTQGNLSRWQLEVAKASTSQRWKQWVATGLVNNALLGGKPRTAVGTRLLGYSDGGMWRRVVAMGLGYLLVVVLCLANKSFLELLPYAFVAIYMLYVLTAWSVLIAFFRNIKYAWLLSMGNRMALFSEIEKTYRWVVVHFLGVIAVLHVVSCIFASEYLSTWQFSILLLIYSLALVVPMLYLAIILYARYGMDTLKYALIGVPSMLLSYVILFIVVHYWPERAGVAVEIVSAYSLLLLGSGLLLRKHAQRLWLRVNFQRVMT